jgi:hypothetical protein
VESGFKTAADAGMGYGPVLEKPVREISKAGRLGGLPKNGGLFSCFCTV